MDGVARGDVSCFWMSTSCSTHGEPGALRGSGSTDGRVKRRPDLSSERHWDCARGCEWPSAHGWSAGRLWAKAPTEYLVQ